MTLFIIRSSNGTSYKKRSEIKNILSTAGEKKIHNLFTIWFTIKSYSRTVKEPRKEKSIVHYTRKITSLYLFRGRNFVSFYGDDYTNPKTWFLFKFKTICITCPVKSNIIHKIIPIIMVNLVQ